MINTREAAALARAAAKAEAVAAAGGELIELPATVDRAGVVTPISLADAGATLAGIIMRAGALTVDVETSGYPVGHSEHVLRTVQLGDDQLAVVLDASDPEQAKIASIALAAAPRLHAHSATADLGPLHAAGIVDIDAWQRMYDTVIPAKLADPTSTDNGDSLKQLAASVLRATAVSPAANAARAALFKAGKWLTDTELTTPIERSGWAQTDRRSTTMVVYAASDVLDTAALVGQLPTIPDAILDRERAVQRITARVTHRGLRLDGEHVARKLAEHGAAMTSSAQRVNAFGIDNPGSDQQVGAALIAAGAHLPLTPTGRPSVAAAALEAIRGMPGHAGALVAAVLDYRHHETVCSTFLEPYRRLVEHGDGRARPTVYTLGTDTGRMSCVRPNLQQLPREGGVRACITADPGYTLISADFAGVELRVAAALSGDANLAGMLARGDDPHWMIAREVFGPEATKADRYAAKRVVFGRLYGGGVPTLARQAGVSESLAASAVDVLDAMTPQLAAWSSAIRNAVKRGQTQFPSYSGRIIWLPAEYPHKGPNYCVGMNTPVLRSDLTHVAASTIKVGDRLVAFDEHPVDGVGGQNRYHHMRTAVVEAVSTVRKPSVRVHTADGKATECSADHLWLVRPLKGRRNNRPRVRWVRADELCPGDDLLSIGTWETATSHAAGYLAGLYDGEGSLARHAGGRRKNQLYFSQLPGQVMDAFRSGMDKLGLAYSYHHRAPNSTSPTDMVVVNGLRDVMRTLGTLRPQRFRERFESVYEGNAITAGLTESVAVTAVEPIGTVELASIQTSTRTLVANGYLSHNCIQGSARELLVDALLKWDQTEWAGSVVLPVHDEIVAVVPEADGERATAALVAAMSSSLGGVEIRAEASEPSVAWRDSV